LERNNKKKYTRRPPLNEKHYEAIALLAEYGRKRLTHERIARKLRINRRTLYRWRQRPDFDNELRKAIDRQLRKRFGTRRIDGASIAVRTGDIAYLERFFSAFQAVQSE
jgi:DNA invertase Pin-like site-specific DNA recombinase